MEEHSEITKRKLMNERGQEPEIAEVISALIDGGLDAEAFEQVQDRLKQDPQARRTFINLMLLDAELADQFSAKSLEDMVDILSSGDAALGRLPSMTPTRNVPRQPRDSRRSARFSRSAFPMLLAVLVGFLGLTIWFLIPFDKSSQLPLGSITRVSDMRSTTGKKPFQAGRELGAEVVVVETGTVEILLRNGVKILVQGSAQLELHDLMHARLLSGRALFNVPPSAIGFVCETAEASVIDLGTEFGVQAGEPSGTAVQVYLGEVIANATSNEDHEQRGRRVQSGQAVRITKGENAYPEELPFLPNRFVRMLPDPKDGRDPEWTHTGIYNRARYEELHIVPATQNLEIDGNLQDWDLSGQFRSHCETPFAEYYHVRGAAMYDREYLYLAADVGDPFPMRSTVSPHIQRNLYGHGGCLAFRISTDRKMGWPVRGRSRNDDFPHQLVDEDLNDKLVFLVLWYYEPEKLPCLHLKYGMDEHDRKVNPEGYRGAFRKHANGLGYTAEYAIPWSQLNAEEDPPQPGDTLGLTWLVHWSGPEGRNWRGQLIDVVNPKESGWNFDRAATWGRAIYEKQTLRP